MLERYIKVAFKNTDIEILLLVNFIFLFKIPYKFLYIIPDIYSVGTVETKTCILVSPQELYPLLKRLANELAMDTTGETGELRSFCQNADHSRVELIDLDSVSRAEYLTVRPRDSGDPIKQGQSKQISANGRNVSNNAEFTRKRGVVFYSTIISGIHLAAGEIKRSARPL